MTNSGVCIVTHPLSAAGENATRTLLDILAELGPVSLVTADLPVDSTIRSDHDVIELTQKGAGDTVLVAASRFFLNQLRMCAAIWRQPEDIVLFFGATSYLLPIIFARTIGKKVLIQPRGNVPLTLRLKWEQRMPETIARILSGIVRWLENRGYSLASVVVTYTPNMARELGIDPEAANVYPHGARYVDTEKFSIQKPFDERKDVIGFLGRIDEEKGIRELAEVAKQLPDGITFRFVGDGPLYDWLKAELAQEIESGDVEITGWINHEEVPGELNQMKLLVMPSQPTEGLPTVILESLACGTLVYATPVAGVADVDPEAKTVFHMISRNPSAIRDAIVEILNRSDLPILSSAARELVVEEYSFEVAVDRYQSILNSL